MRVRKVVEIGNAMYIKLEKEDIKDFELYEGDVVDINDMLLIPRIKPKRLRRKKK